MPLTSEKNITRPLIVQAARDWLGTPYVHQASCLGVGCDCLGLVRGVWRTLYQNEPEVTPNYSPDWAEAKREETLHNAAARWMKKLALTDRKLGDVILFRWRENLPAKHIAILTDGSHFIHACEGVPVSEVALNPWWQRRLAYAFQFPNLTEE